MQGFAPKSGRLKALERKVKRESEVLGKSAVNRMKRHRWKNE